MKLLRGCMHVLLERYLIFYFTAHTAVKTLQSLNLFMYFDTEIRYKKSYKMLIIFQKEKPKDLVSIIIVSRKNKTNYHFKILLMKSGNRSNLIQFVIM